MFPREVGNLSMKLSTAVHRTAPLAKTRVIGQCPRFSPAPLPDPLERTARGREGSEGIRALPRPSDVRAAEVDGLLAGGGLPFLRAALLEQPDERAHLVGVVAERVGQRRLQDEVPVPGGAAREAIHVATVVGCDHEPCRARDVESAAAAGCEAPGVAEAQEVREEGRVRYLVPVRAAREAQLEERLLTRERQRDPLRYRELMCYAAQHFCWEGFKGRRRLLCRCGRGSGLRFL